MLYGSGVGGALPVDEWQRRLLGSFNHGSISNAMPPASGARLEYPRRQMVALSGDGGLAMLLGELLSLQQLRIPLKPSNTRDNQSHSIGVRSRREMGAA